MGTSEARKVSTLKLGTEIHGYIEGLVKSGAYASASEVVRDAVRKHRAERARQEAIQAVKSLVAGIAEEDVIQGRSIEDVLNSAIEASIKRNG